MYHVSGIMYYANYKHSVHVRVLILYVFWCHTDTLICCSGEANIVSWTICMYVKYVIRNIEFKMWTADYGIGFKGQEVCTMYHIALCIMYGVICILYSVLCLMYHALCAMHYVICILEILLHSTWE